MASRSSPSAPDATAALVSWLVTGAAGPALVALPVNWAAAKLAGAAARWFKRVRKADDLSRLVKAAAGSSVDMTKDEFGAVRTLLEKEQTWQLLSGIKQKERLAELTARIAGCLPPRAGRTADDARGAARSITRGLIEFAVFELEPATFQKVALARLTQMGDQASAVDEALFRLHKDLYYRFDEVRQFFQIVSDQLPPAPADLADVRIYLHTLVTWLNADPWPADPRLRGAVLSPAAIERKLRVAAVDRTGGQEADADDLARRCDRLVILGGPGSGKTWLAMRTARITAQEALDRLDRDVDASLDEVELPLFSTCSRLIQAPGHIREAIASSALNWLGDLGGARIVDALAMTFAARNGPTLLVIDSLDEASDPGAARERLRQADSLAASWRIVLTSRPSSWNGQLGIDSLNPAHRVGELQPLRYPDDVEPIISRWFAANPARGQELAAQLEERVSLQQDATVPLILAFYCLLGGEQPLPEFRHSLHEQVVNRMLRAPWRLGGGAVPDPAACRRALRDWAWLGAQRNHPVSGVGEWEDDVLVAPAPLSPAGQLAVDHVATAMGGPDFDTDLTPRRFVHRSIREHLVAEYVAGLPAGEAAEILLPHLWYDADWEYAAPAAISTHPERDRLLRLLLARAARSRTVPDDLSDIDVGGEIRRLLVRLATESAEEDWSPELALVIGEARIDAARKGPVGEAAAGVRWPGSTGRIRELLLARLEEETADEHQEFLSIALARLDPARRGEHFDRVRQARQAMAVRAAWWARERAGRAEHELDLLDVSAGSPDDSLVARAQTVDEKRQARDELLDRLSAGPAAVTARWLAFALAELEPTDEDKHRARQVLLAQLSRETDGISAAVLASVLVEFEPTAQEKRQARDTLRTRPAEGRTDSLIASMHTLALVSLDVTAAELAAWHASPLRPDSYLLGAARRNSTLTEWLDCLPTLARKWVD